MEDLKIDNTLVTLGTDYNKKFAWVLQDVNDTPCIVLYKRSKRGTFKPDEKEIVTIKPIQPIFDTFKEMKGIL